MNDTYSLALVSIVLIALMAMIYIGRKQAPTAQEDLKIQMYSSRVKGSSPTGSKDNLV